MIDYAAVFAEQRSFLWGYCYRLVGSASDAEDIVQETFVRVLEKPPQDLERPIRPWLIRVASNLARDRWRAVRRDYIGTWLPSPIETEGEGVAAWRSGLGEDVEGRYEALESVSFAFLLTLERLTPRQRAVVLLRDVYDYSGRETAEALDLSIANVKTTLHRARRMLSEYETRREIPSPELAAKHRRALDELLQCFASRDAVAMERLLASDVRATSDANGEYYAARVPVVGRAKVALFFSRIFSGDEEKLGWEVRTINGLPALLFRRPEATGKLAGRWMFRLELDSTGRITETQAVLADDKLTAIAF